LTFAASTRSQEPSSGPSHQPFFLPRLLATPAPLCNLERLLFPRHENLRLGPTSPLNTTAADLIASKQPARDSYLYATALGRRLQLVFTSCCSRRIDLPSSRREQTQQAMAAARKRPRESNTATNNNTNEDHRAECPFSVKVAYPRDGVQKKKKRRRTDGGEEDDVENKIHLQMSPFAPCGKFKTNDSMDLHYQVMPAKRWTEMTRYNSFVCKLQTTLSSPASPACANQRPTCDSERGQIL